MKKIQTQGFIAITSVLILSAVFLSITVSTASRSITSSGTSVAFFKRDVAQYLAHACLDYARMELMRTLDYRGDEVILINGRSCEILEIEGAGNTDRIVKVRSEVDDHTYSIKETIETVSPEMIIGSTERVSQF